VILSVGRSRLWCTECRGILLLLEFFEMRFSFRFVGEFLEVSLVIGLELARFGLGFGVIEDCGQCRVRRLTWRRIMLFFVVTFRYFLPRID